MPSLHLIPVPLFADAKASVPVHVQSQAVMLKHYFVENLRTARRTLKLYDKDVVIDEISFVEIGKNAAPDPSVFATWIAQGHDIGLMSEAGCPAVADPGSLIVAWAHAAGVPVHPYTGPNSIILALMASGFDGQNFQFVGYLPIQQHERAKTLQRIQATGNTQIFIEAPYRNNQLLAAICKELNPNTLVCIASELTAPNAFILTQSVAQWKAGSYDFHKKPTIFLVGHSSASQHRG